MINFSNLKVLTKTQYLFKIKHNLKDRMILIKTNNKGEATSCYWYNDGFKLAMRYDHEKIEKFIIEQFNIYRTTLV